MGTSFLSITGDPAPPGILESSPDGIVYVVSRIERKEGGKIEIHLQGIASDKKMAVAMCRDESYFIGPIPLNVLLPESRIEWFGIEYPLREK